jgi:polar amino acid transport system substrate-binding protein
MGCALLLVVVVLGATLSVGAGDSITFALFTRGWPPFEMVVEGEPQGAALDIFRASMPAGVEPVVSMKPAARSALRERGDTLYTRLECIDWMDDAENFLWSEPVMTLETVLYSTSAHPVEYRGESSLFGLTIGCIKGFNYPEVETLFESGKANRYNVNSDLVLLRMLKAGRVDVALFDRATVNWLIRNSIELRPEDYHVAADPLGRSQLRFAFSKSPEMIPLLKSINERIRVNREQGVYDRIMEQYR